MSPIRSVRPAHLSGPRCLLREWVDSDAEALHALTNEPQVADRMLDEHPPSPAEVRQAPNTAGRSRRSPTTQP